jgi:hypothetical protein
MRALIFLMVAGCAASPPRHEAPPTKSGGGGGEASSPEREPEIVHTGKSLKLNLAQTEARYKKGERCGGADSPEAVLGAPDQKNEMMQGREKLVTYGFRFPEGTLMIRCRADHVETIKRLN